MSEINPETFGQRLRKAREDAGLSRAELGRQVGLSEDMLVRYEAGTHEPKLTPLRRLAKAVGVPIEKLIGEK